MEDKKYCYKYPHPAVTADNVIFGFDNKELNVLLIKRKHPPYKDRWAFPGGFMNMDETIEQCAKRELEEETGFKAQRMEQLMCFSDVERDPRERVITVAFFALVRMQQVRGGDDALQAEWFKLQDVPPLAFDHDYIFRVALSKLKERVHFEPVCFELLGEQFTMSELQRLYEAILQVKFDRRNFFRKIQSWGILKRVDENEEISQESSDSEPNVAEIQDFKEIPQQEDFSLDFSGMGLKTVSKQQRPKHLGVKGLQELFGNISSGVNDTKSKETSSKKEDSATKSNPRATVHYTFDRERYNEKKNEGFRLEF